MDPGLEKQLVAGHLKTAHPIADIKLSLASPKLATEEGLGRLTPPED